MPFLGNFQYKTRYCSLFVFLFGSVSTMNIGMYTRMTSFLQNIVEYVGTYFISNLSLIY